MRQIQQLPIVKEVNANFPFGAILNETDTQDGTPIVREIYNDPLVNFYKLMQITGVVPSGTEDSENTQYQLIDALKKLPNLLNDVEQVLTLSSGVWSVPFNLALLPDKYVFIARASDNYTPGTFTGINPALSYGFSSPGFNASDEIIVIIDQSGVRAYSLSSNNSNSPDEVFTVMGLPVSFNDNTRLYYQEEGNLLSDVPNVAYLQDVIRDDVANAEALVTDIFILQGYVLCVVFFPTSVTYRFYQFPLNDYSESTPVDMSNFSIPTGIDNEPYFFCDGLALYITNANGTTANDNEISFISYNGDNASLAYSAVMAFDVSFVKTTNTAIKNKIMYTIDSGNLYSYDVNTGVKTSYGRFNGAVGQLFNFNDQIYFTTGEVGKKWF